MASWQGHPPSLQQVLFLASHPDFLEEMVSGASVAWRTVAPHGTTNSDGGCKDFIGFVKALSGLIRVSRKGV